MPLGRGPAGAVGGSRETLECDGAFEECDDLGVLDELGCGDLGFDDSCKLTPVFVAPCVLPPDLTWPCVVTRPEID